MEVHHHAHAPHGKKKWTHYFWEFLMLFLAVFCGFLAEYQLEHKIEKERGQQFIESFYQDLITDTSRFNKVIKYYEKQVTAFKDRESCYRAIMQNKRSDSCIISLFSAALGFSDLIYSDRTLQQLKNAGGLRLIKKQDADSILLYDDLLRLYVKQETTALQETQYSIRNLIAAMINHSILEPLDQNSKLSSLYTYDPEQINRFFNLLYNYNYYCNLNLQKMKSIKFQAINLIEYFKKKYHFK